MWHEDSSTATVCKLEIHRFHLAQVNWVEGCNGRDRNLKQNWAYSYYLLGNFDSKSCELES